MARATAPPLEPAEDVVRRLRATASGLPDAYEEDTWLGVRWRVRGRTFAHVLVAQPGRASAYFDAFDRREPATVLTFRAAGDELVALHHAGWPYYRLGWTGNGVGMVLDDATDWTEVAELVTESYRVQAPRRLSRLLDASVVDS